MITLQNVFDAAWQKFIIEEAPAATMRNRLRFGDEFVCCYLTDDGRKCAIGLCIPDGNPAQKTLASVNTLKVRPYHLDFAYDINNEAQYALHDGLIDSTTGKWKYSLEERRAAYINFAIQNSLTVKGFK